MIATTNKKPNLDGKNQVKTAFRSLHPAWQSLIAHCQEIGYGEIERVKIQDGIPVLIEKTITRTKLT